jgi:hypothetical protein
VGTYVRVPHALKPADLAFFSGFVAGDGCFQIRENNAGTSWCCSLDVRLRADNTPLLAEFRNWSGAGELFATAARGGSHPQTGWLVARQADCLQVARILDRFPPQPVSCQVDITAADPRTLRADSRRWSLQLPRQRGSRPPSHLRG